MKDSFKIKDVLNSVFEENDLYRLVTGKHIVRKHTELGSVLRKKDAEGRWYFMPVTLTRLRKSYEVPNARIAFTGKKTIVETKMTGRVGTVKELINTMDYEITIEGVYVGDDFPDLELAELNELYSYNESIVLDCALTDIFLDQDDKVVIKDMTISNEPGKEGVQKVKLTLVTDRNFEMTIN